MRCPSLTTALAAAAISLGFGGGTALLAQTQSGPAYLVVELDVMDQEGFSEYGEKVPATLSQYGGDVIVGGVAAEPVEGAEPQGNIIIVRFDSLEAAKTWMNSPEYSAIKPIRQRTAETRSYLVEGSPEQ